MKAFQRDLRNGMKLEDALSKHNLTLQQAFTKLNKTERNKYHNITLKGRKFVLEKQIYHQRVRFSFTELKDAVLVRDYLDSEGWSQEAIKKMEDKLC